MQGQNGRSRDRFCCRFLRRVPIFVYPQRKCRGYSCRRFLGSTRTGFPSGIFSVICQDTVISLVEKLYYLRTCLKGKAALLIGDLSVTGENFIRAWTELTRHYENKRLLVSLVSCPFFVSSCLKVSLLLSYVNCCTRLLTRFAGNYWLSDHE